MRLRKVRLENFRAIRDATLDFAGPDGEPVQVMALVGPNGSGKTAWLDAIAGFFTHWVPEFGGEGLSMEDVREGAQEMRVECEWRDGRQSLFAELLIQISHRRDGRIAGSKTFSSSDGEVTRWSEEARTAASACGAIVLIDAHRYFNPGRVNGPNATRSFEHHASASLATFVRQEQPMDDGPRELSLRQWIVNLEFARARAKADRGESFPAWDHLVRALDTLLAPCRFERVSESFEVLFRTPSGVVPMARLSSGYQSVLVIVTELLMRLSLAAEDPARLFEVEAVCMVDEIDAHLHPAWQDRILDDLRWIFPKVQFLVTTHSERVVASLAPHEISVLEVVEP